MDKALNLGQMRIHGVKDFMIAQIYILKIMLKNSKGFMKKEANLSTLTIFYSHPTQNLMQLLPRNDWEIQFTHNF
jgi:hypothetical protein